ncbi:peptidase family M13 [Teladorsagia circumcincta]|uniref:Peptidase family M13 n=1 Tax=Teladorsagia circumcincta TaxID=45464 RepID=A0A2G9ULP5_TELCI|nr:peptidase family M13 [Teladorsagia circumcincta]
MKRNVQKEDTSSQHKSTCNLSYRFSTQCCPEKEGNVHCANGATTQGENIADLGGQQAAYYAYQQYISETNGEEKRLPGLEKFTPNQLFWITYGSSWCAKQTDSRLVKQVG